MKIYYFCRIKTKLAQMSKILAYMIISAALHVTAAAQTTETGASLQEKICALAADPALSQALTGICVRTAGGKTIAEYNSGKMMVPASNMKLITTGAALHNLGEDYMYETSVGYSGNIINGVLHGDLYIIGGGDPTTGSKDSIAVALERTFGHWEAIVRSAGIRKIEGRIVGDGRHFDGMTEEPTWLWNDIGTYYGTGATGLMFYENTQSFSVSAGPHVGSAVNIKPYYPDTPWMTFRYDCTTGKNNTGDRLYMYASDLAPVAEIRGTFGADKAAKRLDCANKYPEYTCAHYFRNFLKSKGLECTEGVTDFRLKRMESPDSLCILGSTFSPSLKRITFETNHASNNLFAETLLRTLGKEICGSASYDSSYVALDRVLESLGIDISHGLKVQDGSGLSRQNHVSPDFLCRFLDAMTDSPAWDAFLKSLPYPGGHGSLAYNMKGQPESLRKRIRVKSGSMNGVRCYSGYVLPSGSTLETAPKDDIIIFSIMTNNCTSPTWKVRPLLDRMMATIASEN